MKSNWNLWVYSTIEIESTDIEHFTIQETNVSHLGIRNIIFKKCLSRGYVASLEGNELDIEPNEIEAEKDAVIHNEEQLKAIKRVESTWELPLLLSLSSKFQSSTKLPSLKLT